MPLLPDLQLLGHQITSLSDLITIGASVDRHGSCLHGRDLVLDVAATLGDLQRSVTQVIQSPLHGALPDDPGILACVGNAGGVLGDLGAIRQCAIT
ncbi:hypothetical protein D3C80_1717760 [compost metagenome]